MTRRELLAPLGDGLRVAGPRRPCWPSRAAWPGAATGSTTTPLAATAAALRRQGEAGHPPVHERRPVAGRHVRPQAGARQVRTASRCRRPTCAPSARPAPRCRRRSSSRSTARAASRSASCSRTTAEHIDDICVIRSMHADVPNHEPSLMLMNCGDGRLAAAEHGLVGHLRPGHREPEPARLRRHVPRRLSDRRSRRTGSRRSCPASTRARTSTRSTPTSTS